MANEAGVTRDELHQLLSTGVSYGASDIHFRPGARPLYRVKKRLVPLDYPPLTGRNTKAIADLILANGIDGRNSDEIREARERMRARRDVAEEVAQPMRRRGS